MPPSNVREELRARIAGHELANARQRERLAPELALIQRSRRITPIYVNEHAAIVKVN